MFNCYQYAQNNESKTGGVSKGSFSVVYIKKIVTLIVCLSLNTGEFHLSVAIHRTHRRIHTDVLLCSNDW